MARIREVGLGAEEGASVARKLLPLPRQRHDSCGSAPIGAMGTSAGCSDGSDYVSSMRDEIGVFPRLAGQVVALR